MIACFVLVSHIEIVSAEDKPESPEASTPEVEEEVDESEIAFYSDRYIFRSKTLDDLILVVLVFERGRQEEGFYGEFFGAIFERNHWAFLEGNDKYAYASSDLKNIFPSYYANVEGTNVSGFVLGYDAGDYTIEISSGPVEEIVRPDEGPVIEKSIGVAEAVVTIHGKEHWGDLVHESLLWKGFNGLKRYKGLFKDYQAFYLKTDTGQQIYLHQNKSDRNTFKKKYDFSETLAPEVGVIFNQGKNVHTFKPPMSLTPIEQTTPPFALYKIPKRWEIEVDPELGSIFLWSRDNASINWLLGGYAIMAIEGIIKNNGEEERVWGFSEYYP